MHRQIYEFCFNLFSMKFCLFDSAFCFVFVCSGLFGLHFIFFCHFHFPSKQQQQLVPKPKISQCKILLLANEFLMFTQRNLL